MRPHQMKNENHRSGHGSNYAKKATTADRKRLQMTGISQVWEKKNIRDF